MRHQKVDRIATEAAKFQHEDSFIDIYAREFLRGADWKKRVDEVVLRDKFVCQICDRPIDAAWQLWDVDHIVKRSDGGSDDLTNLRMVHRFPCHQERHPEKQVRWSSQEASHE